MVGKVCYSVCTFVKGCYFTTVCVNSDLRLCLETSSPMALALHHFES